jgi:hypothetical protein
MFFDIPYNAATLFTLSTIIGVSFTASIIIPVVTIIPLPLKTSVLHYTISAYALL